MNTRYPILLVHGLAMKDTFFMKSFGRIDEVLAAQGYTIYKSSIDSFGSIQGNAVQLRREVLNILAETGADKVNIIAHSKGGLDAKHMLRHFGLADQVASLTTICTPHKGSPIATFMMRLPKPLLHFIAWCVDTCYTVLGDSKPDSLTACRQLQRTQTADDAIDGVYCQSYSAGIRPSHWYRDASICMPLLLSHVMESGQVTDGMVPQDSAVFGDYHGHCIDSDLSHTGVIDFMLPTKQRSQVYVFYTNLCHDLVSLGL